MTEFDFQTQLAIGERGEKILDSFYSKMFQITPVPPVLQRFGIDRVFSLNFPDIDFPAPSVYVEYKTDFRAHQTGNCFVETEILTVNLNSESESSPGWAPKTLSDYICYFLPANGHCYWFESISIKCNLSDLAQRFSHSDPVPNKSTCGRPYFARGILVPLSVLNDLAGARFDIISS